MMKKTFLVAMLTFVLIKLSSAQHGKATADLSFIAQNLEWKGVAIQDDDYTIWGCAPIEGADGKIHLFAARWPEKNVNPAWRKSSEIAHYVADHPEGPFVFSDVAIKGTGEDTWDKYAPHNPEIKKVGDRYVLLYIANTDYHGQNTGIRGGGTLWKSTDGVTFDLKDAAVGYDRIPAYYPNYDPAKVVKIYGPDPKLERPKILMMDGRPAYLYAPGGWNVFGGDRTVCHVLKINIDE